MINWPAGFDACSFNCTGHVLLCVWTQMSCGKWRKLNLELDFTVRHTRAIIIEVFVNKFNCSKHDVTIVSGGQAKVRTCNGYGGSNVLSFCSNWRQYNSLLLLTVIMKVLVECIIEPAQLLASPGCQVLMEQSEEMQKLAKLYYRIGNIYWWLHTLEWSSKTKNTFISNFIMILSIFEY